MDLHNIVSGAIGAVNPFVQVQVKLYTGLTAVPGGKRTPTYSAASTVSVQRQAFTVRDLQHLDGLNIQGTLVPIYCEGTYSAVDRTTQSGGDLFQFDNQVWLVVAVLERWPDWSRLALQLQVDEPWL